MGVLHAEGDVGRKFCPRQDVHRPGSELRRCVAGEEKRKLQDQVRTAAQGHLSACPFVGDAGLAPLREVRRQHNDACGAVQTMPHRRHLVEMAVVKGVVLGNDADNGIF